MNKLFFTFGLFLFSCSEDVRNQYGGSVPDWVSNKCNSFCNNRSSSPSLAKDEEGNRWLCICKNGDAKYVTVNLFKDTAEKE